MGWQFHPCACDIYGSKGGTPRVALDASQSRRVVRAPQPAEQDGGGRDMSGLSRTFVFRA